MYTIDYQDGKPDTAKSLIIARKRVFERLNNEPQKRDVIIYRADGTESGRILSKFDGEIIWETHTERNGTVDCKLLKDGKVIPCRTRY